MNKLFCSIFCSVTISTAIFGDVSTFLNEKIFKNRRAGVFVDIGAYDGVRDNSTYFFEKDLGWTGICVEPLSTAFNQLTRNRTCTCVGKAVAATGGTREFIQVYGPDNLERLSGLASKYYLQNYSTVNHQDMHGAGWRIIMVPTVTFSYLCKKDGITHIDYLSINTQGSEEEIIKSIDFATTSIDVISFDNPYNNPTIGTYLTSKGYKLIKRLEPDDIYIK